VYKRSGPDARPAGKGEGEASGMIGSRPPRSRCASPSAWDHPYPRSCGPPPLPLRQARGKMVLLGLPSGPPVLFVRPKGTRFFVRPKGTRFFCSLVLLFFCSFVLLFFCSFVLLFFCSFVLLFSCSLVLLFSCSFAPQFLPRPESHQFLVLGAPRGQRFSMFYVLCSMFLFFHADQRTLHNILTHRSSASQGTIDG
jgi:hypothetical protein